MSVKCSNEITQLKHPTKYKDKIPANPCGFLYNRCNGAPAWAYVSSTFEIQTDSKRVRNSLRMLSPITSIIKSAWFSVILSALFIQFLLAEFRSNKLTHLWRIARLLHCEKHLNACYAPSSPQPCRDHFPCTYLFSSLPFLSNETKSIWNKVQRRRINGRPRDSIVATIREWNQCELLTLWWNL